MHSNKSTIDFLSMEKKLSGIMGQHLSAQSKNQVKSSSFLYIHCLMQSECVCVCESPEWHVHLCHTQERSLTLVFSCPLDKTSYSTMSNPEVNVILFTFKLN